LRREERRKERQQARQVCKRRKDMRSVAEVKAASDELEKREAKATGRVKKS